MRRERPLQEDPVRGITLFPDDPTTVGGVEKVSRLNFLTRKLPGAIATALLVGAALPRRAEAAIRLIQFVNTIEEVDHPCIAGTQSFSFRGLVKLYLNENNEMVKMSANLKQINTNFNDYTYKQTYRKDGTFTQTIIGPGSDWVMNGEWAPSGPSPVHTSSSETCS